MKNFLIKYRDVILMLLVGLLNIAVLYDTQVVQTILNDKAVKPNTTVVLEDSKEAVQNVAIGEQFTLPETFTVSFGDIQFNIPNTNDFYINYKDEYVKTTIDEKDYNIFTNHPIKNRLPLSNENEKLYFINYSEEKSLCVGGESLDENIVKSILGSATKPNTNSVIFGDLFTVEKIDYLTPEVIGFEDTAITIDKPKFDKRLYDAEQTVGNMVFKFKKNLKIDGQQSFVFNNNSQGIRCTGDLSVIKPLIK